MICAHLTKKPAQSLWALVIVLSQNPSFVDQPPQTYSDLKLMKYYWKRASHYVTVRFIASCHVSVYSLGPCESLTALLLVECDAWKAVLFHDFCIDQLPHQGNAIQLAPTWACESEKRSQINLHRPATSNVIKYFWCKASLAANFVDPLPMPDSFRLKGNMKLLNRLKILTRYSIDATLKTPLPSNHTLATTILSGVPLALGW